MKLSESTKGILYRAGMFISLLSVIYIINPKSIYVAGAAFLLAALISIFTKTGLNFKGISRVRLATCLIALIFASYTGSVKSGYLHLVISLFLTIPALYSVLSFSELSRKTAEERSEKNRRTGNKITAKEYAVLALTSVISITTMSTSSPLYPFNFWDDAQLFFTMGRGIVKGLIPYKDLYEQKGPVLYFIHAVCALISDTTFIGVYFLEIIMSFIFVLFSWKIVKLFINASSKLNTVFVIIPICAFIYSANMFHLGDSSEELVFPMLTVILYLALKCSNYSLA